MSNKTTEAYSRTGFSVFLFTQVYSLVGTLILTVTGLFLFIHFADSSEKLSQLLDSLMSFEQTETNKKIVFVMALAIFFGSVFGMLFSFIGMRLIFKGKTFVQRIEKRKLTFGQFLTVLFIALGLWAFGVYIGNIPNFFLSGTPSFFDFGPVVLPYFAYAMIGAPILEELVFRKFILDRIHVYGEVTAAFASALIFGLIHQNSGQFFLAFFIGILFATVYMKTGKIIYTIIMHAIINTLGSVTGLLSLWKINVPPVYEYSAIALLGIIGLLIMIRSKNNEILAIKKNPCANNLASFDSPGFAMMTVYTTITLVTADLFTTLMSLIIDGAIALLCLIPTAMTIATVILVSKKVGRLQKSEGDDII